jgi:hypothetical protein
VKVWWQGPRLPTRRDWSLGGGDTLASYGVPTEVDWGNIELWEKGRAERSHEKETKRDSACTHQEHKKEK